MNPSFTKPRHRPPGNLTYGDEIYIHVGRGDAPCSAQYLGQKTGAKLSLYYADLNRVMRAFAIFKTHNHRLQDVIVAWKDLADDKMHKMGEVFLVGPVTTHDPNYLRAAAAWRCDPPQ